MRPSQLAQIENGYDAYCFDEAISSFGSEISAELESVGGENDSEKVIAAKRENYLRKRLGYEQKFRTPGK